MAFQQDSTADSVTSTPGSDHLHRWQEDGQSSVRFMCSFGGRILPRPHDNQLRYVGGDTRIVAVHRSTTFASLVSKLSKLSGISDITVKYQLPNEDLDALISVTTDEDVDNMLDEYDRSTLAGVTTRAARLRLFLFPPSVSRTSSISSVLHGGSSKQWFLDALNGSASLERGRSEVSSVLSEVPDYLFGLDSEYDTKSKTRSLQVETLSVLSDPGSPASRVAPSPYCSMSSAGGVPADLPPVKTKVEDQGVAGEIKENRIEPDPQLQQQTNHAGNPVFSYISESQLHGQAVHQVPVYYMPSGNLPIRPFPMAVPYVQRLPVPATAGQMYRYPFIPNPVGGGQVYGQMMRPDDINVVNAYDAPPGMIPDGGQVIYGQRNPGMIPAYGLGVVPVGGDLQVADAEVKMGMI